MRYIGFIVFALVCAVTYKIVINHRVKKIRKEFEDYKNKCLKEANEKIMKNSGTYIDIIDLTGAKVRESRIKD